MSNGTDANYHSQSVNATGGTTAATATSLGNLTLPAGGPWIIDHIWGYLAPSTLNAGEASFGHIRLSSVSGDVTPNPAPSRWPIDVLPSFLGTVTGKPLIPLSIWPTNLTASGKAIVSLEYINESARTAGDIVYAGIMYHKTSPQLAPPPFSDRVTAAVSAAGANTVGTITLAEKAKRILGIGCVVAQDNVSTAAEELIGTFTLSSDDIDFAPSVWPWSFASSAGPATNHGLNNALPTLIYPVDIPVLGGARVDVTVNLNAAVTNAAQVSTFIFYE